MSKQEIEEKLFKSAELGLKIIDLIAEHYGRAEFTEDDCAEILNTLMEVGNGLMGAIGINVAALKKTKSVMHNPSGRIDA